MKFDLRELVRKSRELPNMPLAVEVQDGDSYVDDDTNKYHEVLDICLIVSAPGWEDSRYKIEKLFPSVPECRAVVNEIARALAAELCVELCVPQAMDYDQSGSRWIKQQGTSLGCEYEVHWEAIQWLDTGEKQTVAGVETIEGRSGEDACRNAVRRIAASLSAHTRPVSVRPWIPGLGEGHGFGTVPPYPADAPSTEALRAWKREGRSCAAMVRTMLDQVPALSALSLMRAFEVAFGLQLDALTEISRSRAGRLSDAELDQAIEPRIAQAMPRWNRPFLLREAHRVGAGMAVLLRSRDYLHVIFSLHEAFGLDSQAAKILVSSAAAGETCARLTYLSAGAYPDLPLLTALDVRGIAMPEATRERIRVERDPEQLDRWLAKAVVATSLAEVFDDPS